MVRGGVDGWFTEGGVGVGGIGGTGTSTHIGRSAMVLATESIRWSQSLRNKALGLSVGRDEPNVLGIRWITTYFVPGVPRRPIPHRCLRLLILPMVRSGASGRR